MATVQFNIAIDMQTFSGYDYSTIFGSGGHGTSSTTTNNWYYDSGFYEFLTGTGFDVSGLFVNQGTVTDWDMGLAQAAPNPADPWHPLTQNYSYWTFSGLSAPGQDFSNAISHDGATLAAYMPTLLAGNDTIKGSPSADYLLGYGGNDVLNGGLGADTMAGGAGDDTYVVDRVGDTIVENASEGTDLVKSSVSYTLGDNVEKLTLTGDAAINGTGNALENVLNGNGAANTLNGKEGADTMRGGAGDDTYVVDNTADIVTELSSAGTDLVKSSASFTLGANVENLTLTGAGAIDGTGNALHNVITGTGAANTLDGRAGADAMNGGLGDDTYIVDNAGDVVTEGDAAGTDLVKSSVGFTLGANVENLTLTGTAAIDGTGNAGNNVLNGNNAANTLTAGGGDDKLFGFGGDDTLNGGTGNDTLSGGAGFDDFVFGSTLDAATNVDQINGFVVADDTIELKHSVFGSAGAAGTTLAAGAFHIGSSAADAGDRIIYNSTNGNIYYDHDGMGGDAQILFAHVTAGLALTHSDFAIIA